MDPKKHEEDGDLYLSQLNPLLLCLSLQQGMHSLVRPYDREIYMLDEEYAQNMNSGNRLNARIKKQIIVEL